MGNRRHTGRGLDDQASGATLVHSATPDRESVSDLAGFPRRGGYLEKAGKTFVPSCREIGIASVLLLLQTTHAKAPATQVLAI